MDPSIVKLLEEDEDESMHSGADVEALQAALNRDIEGDASTSQPAASDSILPQGSSQTPGQTLMEWQTSVQRENTDFQSQQSLESAQQQPQTLSEMEKKHGSLAETQHQLPADVPKELSHLPQVEKRVQDDIQQRVVERLPAQVPQTSGMQTSEKNPMPAREPDRTNNQDSESRFGKLQKTSTQQSSGTEPSVNPMSRGKQVPFAVLLPAILPQLDKDRAMQLHTLYGKLKKNEIAKDGFVRHMRDIVGDQMLRLAVNKLQIQMGSNQLQSQSQAAARQNNPVTPPAGAGTTQFPSQHSFAQLHQKGPSSLADPSHAMPSSVPMKNIAQKSVEVGRQSDSRGVMGTQISPSSSGTVNQERGSQILSNQQQQQLHFPPTSFSAYGSSNYRPYSGPGVSSPGSTLKPQPQDAQMRSITPNQGMALAHVGGKSQAMGMMSGPKLDRQTSIPESNRVQSGSLSHFSNSPTVQHNSVTWQPSTSKEQNSGLPSSSVKQESLDQTTEQLQKSHLPASQGLPTTPVEHGISPAASRDSSTSTTQVEPNVVLPSRVPSVTSPGGVSVRTPPKKPSVSQKKPLEAHGSSPPLSGKKQKVTGAFLDQSIEQLNDVTAVSGVNLREEEEQLFSGTKEESRVSEASRRVVQEEEERLFLQRTPLQKKLAEIMAKCGLKEISYDVERCLSLCVEERMRGLICNLIRVSKQRVDAEKPRHRTVVSSDVRQQIMAVNQKAREEWEKKQAEAEKLRKLNEPESDGAIDGDKEKDEGRLKSVKVNKEEDDKMRTNAANVAARAAVGGDDMLSKWQLMVEQARQKREGGADTSSGSQAGKDMGHRLLSPHGRNPRDDQEADRRSPISALYALGGGRKFGRHQATRQSKVARSISVKDVIAVLEREPQMSKSALVYRLYEKIRTEIAPE